MQTLVKQIRIAAAREIQRIWRGFSSRVISRKDESRVVLSWRWGAMKPDSVHVAGEFNGWARWRMKLDRVSNEYRISLPRGLFRGKRSFAYKFVVDGLWTCDGTLPMIEDVEGNVNNVYNLPIVNISKSAHSPGKAREAAPQHPKKIHAGSGIVRTPKPTSTETRQYSRERGLPSPSVLRHRRLSHSATIK